MRLDRRRQLGLQLEEQLRGLIRSGALPLAGKLPSTRALATDLGVSRSVVVGAYAQLAAEGYLELRPGAVPVVAAAGREPERAAVERDVPIAGRPFLLRPDLPDLALFPRDDWLRACRGCLRRARDVDFTYGEPLGAARLRTELAPFLARTRGVVADGERIAVFAGSTQALFVLASVLRLQGVVRIGVEDPGHRWRTRVLGVSGLDVVPLAVDGEGLRLDRLDEVDAVVVSPEHHFPSGAVLAPERRRALVEWAVAGGRTIVEHDYDGHFRYDRPPVGALQALAPEHVAYVGSASPLLAPAVRIGWAVLPGRLVDPVATRLFATGIATSRLAQLALAELIAAGLLDRHLRRARAAYKRRRAVLVRELGRRLPDAAVGGAPVGLFVSVGLPAGTDEGAVLEAARAAGISLDGVNEHTLLPQPPGLALGFAAAPEPTLARAVRKLAALARD